MRQFLAKLLQSLPDLSIEQLAELCGREQDVFYVLRRLLLNKNTAHDYVLIDIGQGEIATDEDMPHLYTQLRDYVHMCDLLADELPYGFIDRKQWQVPNKLDT